MGAFSVYDLGKDTQKILQKLKENVLTWLLLLPFSSKVEEVIMGQLHWNVEGHEVHEKSKMKPQEKAIMISQNGPMSLSPRVL